MAAAALREVGERADEVFHDLRLGTHRFRSGLVPGVGRWRLAEDGRPEDIVGGRRMLHLLGERAHARELPLGRRKGVLVRRHGIGGSNQQGFA